MPLYTPADVMGQPKIGSLTGCLPLAFLPGCTGIDAGQPCLADTIHHRRGQHHLDMAGHEGGR